MTHKRPPYITSVKDVKSLITLHLEAKAIGQRQQLQASRTGNAIKLKAKA